MNVIRSLTKSINCLLLGPSKNTQLTFVRWNYLPKYLPKPGRGKAYRRLVHYPEPYVYTIKPLPVTNLGGRDPVSGHLIVKGIGGGIKHKYHWVDFKRIGPKEGPPLEERVLQIIFDGCRTSDVALVGNGDKLRYIIATENMKVGDIIKTSGFIPRIPVLAKEGDAYPLGALPLGTKVNCVERIPGMGAFYAHAAGTYVVIMRRLGNKVVLALPSKREELVDQECMAVVGKVSNIDHNKIKIGSATKNRELGNRPRSGLWQRKKGIHGRKIKKPPALRYVSVKHKKRDPYITLTMPSVGTIPVHTGYFYDYNERPLKIKKHFQLKPEQCT